MLLLTQNATADIIVVTLAEKTTIVGANYLFVFQHITTKAFTKVVLLGVNDQSTAKVRYNQWTINTGALFAAKTGQYIYKVYEQVSATNTNETGLNMVEQGRAEVQAATPFTRKTYAPSTTFTTYAG